MTFMMRMGWPHVHEDEEDAHGYSRYGQELAKDHDLSEFLEVIGDSTGSRASRPKRRRGPGNVNWPI